MEIYATAVTFCYVILTIFQISRGIPLSSDRKHSGKSNDFKLHKQSKFVLPGRSGPLLRGMLNPKTSTATTKAPEDNKKANEKDTTHSVEDFDLANFGDEFAPNATIDYDAMALPEPQQLIEENEDNFPLTELNIKNMHERAQYMRKDEIRKSLLSKLRLLAPPNMTDLKLHNKIKPFPKHLLPDLPEQQIPQSDDHGEEEDTYHAKIETIIQFAEPLPDDKKDDSYPLRDIAYFTIPDTVSKDNINKCMLLVYISTPSNSEGEKVQLVISPTLRMNKPLINRTVTLSSNGHWEHIDVSEMFMEWAGDIDSNIGFVVKALYHGENLANLEEDSEEVKRLTTTLAEGIITKPHRTPLVKITLNEERGRYKRSFDEVPTRCNIEDKEDRCCRYTFSLDFSKLGPDFDFIIQPKAFEANYCAGICPNYYLPPDGNSKLLVGLVPQKLQRCCTPTKKSSLKIIYVTEDGNYNVGEIPEMSIDRCSCST